jgi:hypothetical protein
MEDVPSEKLTLDEQLEGLAAGIVSRLGFGPPEIGAALRPPQLRVAKADELGIKSYTVFARGVPVIMLGGDLYPAIVQYCRAAATFFLPSQPNGDRPSDFWPGARAALATTIDWCTSPAANPRFPQFEVTPRQEQVAAAFAAYIYRFVLCHEMAHVTIEKLGNGDAEPVPGSSGDDIVTLRNSQNSELSADRLGLEFQLRSLPDRSQIVTALSAALYFVYFNALFDDSRLMLLAELVDQSTWNIEYSHPPYLHRVANLMETARLLEGDVAAEGLGILNASLSELIGEIRQACMSSRDRVTDETSQLLSSRDPHLNNALLLTLFGQSPLGVLRAIDSVKGETSNSSHGKAVSHTLDLLAQLPEEFRVFYNMTREERSRELA